ncbi:immunity 49 family protein [Nocardiopsis sp. MT53]|uniref:immunity 49 family protein n=1 Tax=Nocardiopsis sp. MT53 TaxID=2865672 RepID=UPI001C72A77B|nr:immunity 49 family protein [Nocardiopsis sp. MT53]QYX36522.1 immunity 49 family protein [Nocardiopsis sp. MT53]
MTLRIERHRVDEKAIGEALDDFADRIGQDVNDQQHSGRDGFGWKMIGRDLVTYAAARSATDPEAKADIRAALYSAAEAFTGALLLDGAPTSVEVSVHLTYTGTGVSYRDLEEYGEKPRGQRPIAPGRWAHALYLCVISGLCDAYEGPLVQFAAGFTEDQVLHRALAFYVYPGLGAERDQLTGYVESAMAPFFASLEEGSQKGLPDLAAVDFELLFLHALLSRNEQLFWSLMAMRLAWLRDNRDSEDLDALLPVAELAFAALAVRVEGWTMPFDTDYLPRHLVQGGRGLRVGPYGADKDPDALRLLAQGPIEVAHPAEASTGNWTVEKLFKRNDTWMGEAAQADTSRYRTADDLMRYADFEQLTFGRSLSVDPQARHPRQLAAFTHASQFTAAAFACTAAGGESVEVALGESTAVLRTFGSRNGVSGNRLVTAVEYALISGAPERLEALLGMPEELFPRPGGPGTSVFLRYGVALLTYLRSAPTGPGAVPGPRVREALDAALEALAGHTRPGSPPPPVIALSQLVAEDQEGFNLALADALEAYRDAYSFGEQARRSDGLVDRRSLTLACLARMRGWEVRIDSGYLPQGLLDRAGALSVP